MRSLEWALSQSERSLYRQGDLDPDTHTGKVMRRCSSTGAACKPRSRASEEINPVATLTWDIWPPELRPQVSGAQATQSTVLGDSAQDDRHSTRQASPLLVIITQHPCQIRNVSSPPRTAALLSALTQRPFLPHCIASQQPTHSARPQRQLPAPMQPLWSQLPPSVVHSLDSGQLAWI